MVSIVRRVTVEQLEGILCSCYSGVQCVLSIINICDRVSQTARKVSKRDFELHAKMQKTYIEMYTL